MRRRIFAISSLLVVMFLVGGCKTYYQRMQQFNSYFASGQVDKAAEVLENDKRSAKRRNRLLYLVNMGMVQHLLGNHASSNHYFEQAYILGEDYTQSIGDEALAIFSNPKMTEYRGEDFELLMIHYYKAMNFIQLGDYDAALVECRRLNIKQNALADKYSSDNRYKRDAFIHNLMGIIYDASGDYNNAFIAYRNAFDIYEEDYSKLFGLQAPEQLKRDLLRAAHRTGFSDQLDFYERKFSMTYTPGNKPNHGDLVFFWHNGLGPVKNEWSINFTILRGAGGRVDFVNEELGLAFPFYLPESGKSSGDLGDLRIIRVAFPKYVQRKPIYSRARLKVNNQMSELHLAQNINDIAFQSLQDRMLREMGTALLRLAVKQATEQIVRRENENVGAILGILNTVTEQADTRNWQTLPHSIHYTRMSLPQGEHRLNLELLLPNNHTGKTINLNSQIRAGRTSFINYHTIDSRPPAAK